MLDNAGTRPLSEFKRALADDGVYVSVGGQKGGRVLGPAGRLIRTRLASIGTSKRVMPFLARPNREDMDALAELLEAGKIKPAIDRRYELAEIADALAYLGGRHARAKVVVAI